MTVCRTGKKYELPKAQLVLADLPYQLGINAFALRNVDIFAEAELEDKQLARKQKMLEFGGV